MQREERAIVTPAAKVLLVALLVTVARSESRDEPAADFESEGGQCPVEPSRSAFSGGDRSPCRDRCPQGRGVLCGRPAQLEPPGLGAQAIGAGAARVLRPARGATYTCTRALHHLPWTDRRRSQEPTHRLRAGTPEAATLARARGDRRRLDPARGYRRPAHPLPRPPPELPGLLDRGARLGSAGVVARAVRYASSGRKPAGGRATFRAASPPGRRACRTTAYRRAPSWPQVTDAERRDSR